MTLRLFFSSLLVLTLCTCGRAPDKVGSENRVPLNSTFSAEDIPNFWRAYDLVITTTDSAKQADILEREFFAKGTPGLAAIMDARNYSKDEYRRAINDFPAFWNSVRLSMSRASELAGTVAAAAEKLHALYPSDRPAEVYFTVGCFRTNGTVMDSLILFGSELCMADDKVDLSEWTPRMLNIEPYMRSNPVSDLDFLAIHEYTHSRQAVRGGYNLLGEVLFEGIPEFVATLAAGRPSATPAIAFGKSDKEKVRAAFIREIGDANVYNWVQNNSDNAFGVRDLGYYVGYAMAKRYYDTADDKRAALRTMIELDYLDSIAVSAFADATGYFERPVNEYLTAYAARRPTVSHISQFANGAQNVDPALQQITFHFDRPLDPRFRATELGPGGRDTRPNITGIDQAEDGKSVTYNVKLEPDSNYELLINFGYRDPEGLPLIPYLMRFRTSK